MTTNQEAMRRLIRVTMNVRRTLVALCILLSSATTCFAEVFQLTCHFDLPPTDIFVVDTDKLTAVSVTDNIPGQGKLTVAETYYLVQIDRHPPQWGRRLRVNRYTGEAMIEIGDGPYSLDDWPTGNGNPGNTFNVGKCDKGPEKKLL